MKKHCSLFVFLLLIWACDSPEPPVDPEPTLAEQQLTALTSNTWIPGTITQNGQDVSSRFDGFTLTFSGSLNADKSNASGTYTTANASNVLPPGSWSFVAGSIGERIMLNDMEAGYIVTDSTLNLTFNYTEPNARTQEVGDYVFNLVAQ